MAESIDVEQYRLALRARLSDPLFVTMMFFFALGWMTIFAQIESNLPILSQFLDATRLFLPFGGWIIRLMFVLGLGLFLLQITLAWAKGVGAGIRFNLPSFIATLALVAFLMVIIYNLPRFLPGLYSTVPPALNSIMGP
jgi:hypothetical protein